MDAMSKKIALRTHAFPAAFNHLNTFACVLCCYAISVVVKRLFARAVVHCTLCILTKDRSDKKQRTMPDHRECGRSRLTAWLTRPTKLIYSRIMC